MKRENDDRDLRKCANCGKYGYKMDFHNFYLCKRCYMDTYKYKNGTLDIAILDFCITPKTNAEVQERFKMPRPNVDRKLRDLLKKGFMKKGKRDATRKDKLINYKTPKRLVVFQTIGEGVNGK